MNKINNKTKEKDIQKAIIDILKLYNCYVIRFNSGAMRTSQNTYFRAYILPNGKSAGLSDLMFIKNGKVYFIEVKRPNGKIGIEQLNFIEEVKKFGAIAFITDNWESVLEFVKTI